MGGGIPILRPLGTDLAANALTEIYGILNGTTNYILTKMIKEGLPFETALAEAQAMGYAEADPTADVEGHDACRKICILASLAFGRHVFPSQVPTQGITGVTLDDVALAETAGKRIKLLGRTFLQKDGKIIAYVAPHLIDESNLISGVDDVFNGIMVRGNAVDDVMFYGRGAGKLPTASAVAADILDVVKNRGRQVGLGWAPGGDDVMGNYMEVPMAWFIRSEVEPDQIASLLGDVEGFQSQYVPGQWGYLTQEMTRRELDDRLREIPVKTVLPLLA